MTTLLYETHWTDPADGWAIASRAYARAMLGAGLDVHLHSWSAVQQTVDPAVLAEVGDMARPMPKRRWDAYVFSTTLSSAERMQMLLGQLKHYLPPRMLYTTFEREQVEPGIAALMNELDGVWVPCTANAEVLRAAGVREVLVAPHCYFPDDPLLALRERAERHPGPPRFYWIGRWEPRKAPHNLIEAFCRAFEPGQALLTLKLGQLPWRGHYPQPEEIFEKGHRDWLAKAPLDVRVIRGRLPRERVVALHAEHDVYVSASRGEGWDLPAFEAKLAGNRVVTTDSGGPRDFLGGGDVLVPRTGSIHADPHYQWGYGATYADYDVDALADAMRRAAKMPRPGLDDLGRFSAEVVGRQLGDWVLERVARAPRVDEPPLAEPATAFHEWLGTGTKR